MFGTKDRTKDIIDSIWDGDYYLVAAREDAPSKAYLKEYASKNGFKFPKEFLAHASNFYGGLYLEVKEDIWPRAKEFDVGPFWSFLYGIFTYAFNDDAPDWMKADLARQEFDEMGHNVIPLLKVIGDADVYCLNQQSEIVKWDHELDEFEKFEGNFFDLLSYEIKELAERKERKINA